MKEGLKSVLTVAGSDSGAGAGIQADLFTFASMGLYATSAIAALTAQNPNGVRSVFPASPQSLTDQLEAVWEYFKPSAAKCGMLFNSGLINAAADFFAGKAGRILIVDPVMISTSGAHLLEPAAVDTLVGRLMPLASLVTPNLDEAAHILGVKKILRNEMLDAAKSLEKIVSAPVLLKGGHLEGGGDILDVLSCSGETFPFTAPRIDGVNSHGGGCTLSAAIAARMALGDTLAAACANAREYLFKAMRKPLDFGGEKFINHFAM